MYCCGDDVLVLLEVVEVDELDGDVLAVLAEGHRLLAGEPGGELLVGLDQAVAADAHDDRPQPVEHIVGAIGLGGDLGVQADERLAEMVLDERLPAAGGGGSRGAEVVPAEAGDLAGAASEAGADGGVMGDAAAEQVADEGFDGVGFVEGHDCPSALREALSSSRSFSSHALDASMPRIAASKPTQVVAQTAPGCSIGKSGSAILQTSPDR